MQVKRFIKDTVWIKPKIEHAKPTKYGWVVLYPDNLELGYFTDIGMFTLIQAEYGVVIGDNTQIGAHCAVYSISTEDCKFGKIEIGKHVRIGSHCSIMPGVTIGDYAVIGAHSFVNKSIPPYALAYGVPVKIVKENYNHADQPGGEDCGRGRWVWPDRKSDSEQIG